MSGLFTCHKCEAHRALDLLSHGKRKPVCRICEGHRKHVAKASNPLGYVQFEAKYFDDRRLDAADLKRCASCKEEKPKTDKWHSGKCWPCHLEWSRSWKARNRKPGDRLDEYRKQNERRGCETYGSREKMLAAKKAPIRNSRGVQISFDAGDSAIEECMSRLARRNAMEWFRHYIRTEASDEWVERFYAAAGKPWGNPRLTEAEQWRTQYRHDRRFAAKERMRRQVTKAMKRDGIAEIMRGAVNRGGKSKTVEQNLGYTIAQLCEHLEKQFEKGMTWERFSSGDIHIDHITPQAAFNLSDPEQWRACWCLSNLQPRWARDNLIKRDRRIYLI